MNFILIFFYLVIFILHDPTNIFMLFYLYHVFVVFLFCVAFSFCQIALAFLCWMLISVGFYFGLQKKKTEPRTGPALNSKAIFYANNTTYFLLYFILLLLLFFFFLGGGWWGVGFFVSFLLLLL